MIIVEDTSIEFLKCTSITIREMFRFLLAYFGYVCILHYVMSPVN